MQIKVNTADFHCVEMEKDLLASLCTLTISLNIMNKNVMYYLIFARGIDRGVKRDTLI